MESFPVFRKYANERSFFRIDSMTRFTEVKLTGKNVEEYEFEARIFPDRQLIHDMIDMLEGRWVESSQEEFEAFRSR